MSVAPARPNVPRVRSALFVPATQQRYLDGVDRRDVDAVVVDLEDSVAAGGRDAARRRVSAWLEDRAPDAGAAVFARINPLADDQLDVDLDAVVHPALRAVVLPKVVAADDVRHLSAALAWHEGRRGLPFGGIAIWPLVETARAVRDVAAIAASDARVAYLGGATARDGDLARELGFEVTGAGLETLVLRSHVLIAARAAGVRNPMTGMFTGLDDPVGFESFARQSRQLGYEGIMVIHPSHVAIANAVFGPDDAAVADAHAVIAALEQAAHRGEAAVRHDGRMIDTAMAETARRVIADHQVIAARREAGADRSSVAPGSEP